MVVESEGNGRMCLTLPEVLITVMGIEKLVPTWRDLEVFLQLLPRSSTAERMNPYTSMWTGVTPGDGPQAFHLILLDNGRTDVLSDTVGRQALRCIRCSACLNVCPVYERTGGQAYGSALSRARSARSSRRSCAASPGTRSTSRPRRCRSRRRCAAPASTSARSGSTSPRSSSTCAARSSASTEASHRLPTGEEAGDGRRSPGRSASPRRLGLAERAAGLGGRVVGAARPDPAAAAARAARRLVPRAATSRRRPANRSGPGGAGPTADGDGQR